MINLLKKRYPLLEKEIKEIREINDLPIMISERGEIVCIPKKKEIPSPIGCVSKKGQGKSLILHRIIDSAFWNWGINVSNMNDFLEESYDWNKAQNNEQWITNLEELGQVPTPLPVVYVYPNNKNLKLNEVKYGGKIRIDEKNINYVKISLPFEELLNNIDKFMKLEKSGIYLKNLKSELLECNDPDEVEELINLRIDVGKSSEIVRNKIINNFRNIWDEEILHITNKDCPEQLKIGDYYGNPFVALMNIGVVPSFITSHLWTQPYKAQIYAYHINSIFNAQSNIFKDKKTYLVFDELTKVCSTEEKNDAGEALENISARGRMKNIGLVYATQNYAKIPHIIRSNTEYLFALRHSNKKEVSEIKKDMSLPDFDESVLLKLKKLECLAMTSEYFVVYKPNGDIEKVSDPIKGRIIPPLSRHKLG